MSIGKIEIVPLRNAFHHEAHMFTRWLETNIDALSQRLGIGLTAPEREKAVGSFNVDLFCEDKQGNYVIIENQLERSDPDHLGKLLTYLRTSNRILSGVFDVMTEIGRLVSDVSNLLALSSKTR
jgi:RecB family endonuclease NucS